MSKAARIVGCVALLIVGNASAGSIFDETTYQAYTADRRAAGLGDVVTIFVVEAANAEARTNTKAGKDTSFSAGVTDMVAIEDLGLSVGRGSDGGGEVERSGEVRARLTAEVVKVLDNGLLVLEGRQLIQVNDEEQRISVRGWARPRDIAGNNTILSTRLVNAEIEYMGEGILAESQEPGLLYRFFNWLGLL